MHDEHDNGLTPQEIAALGALPRSAEPPRDLEDRVVDELTARAMIRRRPGWVRITAVAASLIAALALAYAGGVRAGAGSAAPPELEGPVFALLVYDPVGGLPPAPFGAAVEEASAWAEELAAAGILRGAEKLRDGGRRLALQGGSVQRAADFPPPEVDLVLGGFFLIRADDYDDAQRIARECPLLRFGSTIEIRAFEEI